MEKSHSNDSLRYFVIITITATAVVIIDLIARAFFYEQEKYLAPYLPLLIGSITLCAMGIIARQRKRTAIAGSQSNTAATRRVRVTGPIK